MDICSYLLGGCRGTVSRLFGRKECTFGKPKQSPQFCSHRRSQEKAGLFRRYAQLNSLVIIAAFAVAVVWIIISATRHTTAQSKCEKKFFPIESTGETTSEGETICNIFPWVDIGIMGGLWVLLAIVQVRRTISFVQFNYVLHIL